MRKLWTLGLLLAAPALVAQQGPPPRPAVEALQQQIMERFLAIYRTQAGLSSEQDRRFREVFRRSLDQRRDIQERERQLWQALEGQMRPGVAANADSVTKLLDGVIAQRAALVEQTRNEQREYAQFLTPVQRGQLALTWERFQQQVEQIRRRRMEMRQGGRMPPDTMPFPDTPSER